MIVRTCTIKKYDDECSICELHRVKNNYNVKLIFDHDNLFVDFKLALNENEAPEIAIKIFEEECLNRFTCYGEFTIEEAKEHSGEVISFS
jgi:hypothetical protein